MRNSDSLNKNFERLLRKYIVSDVFRIKLSDDKDSGQIIEDGIASRDTHYTELLNNYKRLTRVRNILKEIHKWLFFWMVVSASLVVIVFLVNFVNNNQANLNENYVAIITAIISLITTLVSVPIVITKYLFNNKEDDNITQIISKTQEHDSAEIELLIDRFRNDKPYIRTVPKKDNAKKYEQFDDDGESEKSKEIHAIKEMITE